MRGPSSTPRATRSQPVAIRTDQGRRHFRPFARQATWIAASSAARTKPRSVCARPIGRAKSPRCPRLNRLVIALAQIPFIVGDIAGNRDRLRKAGAEAAAFGADLVMAPELYLAGYPPEDLVLKPAFQEACRAACEELARETAEGPAILVGLPWVEAGKLYNAMALLNQGRIEAVRFKVDLPNYGVFDEKRVFTPGPSPGPIVFRGVRIASQSARTFGPRPGRMHPRDRRRDSACRQRLALRADKLLVRQNVAVSRVVESGLPLIYLNMIGGQDEIVFEGASFALNADRSLAVQLPAFRPMVARTVWERSDEGWRCVERPREVVEEGTKPITRPACWATRLRREQPVSGRRSGPLRRRQLGPLRGDGGRRARVAARPCGHAALPLHLERVAFRRRRLRRGARRPLRHRADRRAGRGRRTCARENVRRQRPASRKNIQSRARGLILMAISNKTGAMLVTTGNKSEMSVGYATLYGDMNGGFNPIKDLYKMEVFRLSALRNRWKPFGALGPDGEVVPENILVKPPSAELRENQKDEDFLPPYPVLDGILHGLVEKEMRVRRPHRRRLRPRDGAQGRELLYLAEYKRRQSAPGVKGGPKNFGRDRRYPIVNRFRDPGLPAQAPDAAIAPRKPAGTSERFEE